MLVKRLLIILTVSVVLALSVLPVSAESETALLQAYAWQQHIDIFLTGEMDTESISCKVSNQTAEIIDSGLVAEGGIAVRTTVLIDVSASIPAAARETVKTYINSLLEGFGAGEQYRLAVFGERLSILTDFSVDRDILLSAAADLAFTERESIIYDAIYNTIPSAAPVDGEPCYYRTIVITDGVDDTTSGVTKEELYIKLQADTYQIDVVAVSAGSRTEQSKELAALTRMSGGRYISLTPQSDAAELAQSLATDEIVWLRARVPSAMLDGAVRQIDVTDGVNTVKFDIKISAFDASDVQTEEDDPKDKLPVKTDTEDRHAVRVDLVPASPERTPETEETPESEIPTAKRTRPELFIGVVVGVIAIFIVVMVTAFKSGGRKPGEQPGGGTEVVIGAMSPGGITRVRLRSADNTTQVWELSLAQAVYIGRDPGCQVHVADGSMSRRQCRLYAQSSAMAENLSSSNITLLNGEPLRAPAAIKAGDRLKCGRVTLIVDTVS